MNIQENNKIIRQLLHDISADACLIPVSDPYLSEYVPIDDNFRYYLTGFTGSTGHVVLVRDGFTYLFVDGRYHEQARKQQVEPIKVIEVGENTGLDSALLNFLQESKFKSIAYVPSRTSQQLLDQAAQHSSLVRIEESTIAKLVNFKGFVSDHPIQTISDEICGESVWQKFVKIRQTIPENGGLFVIRLDSISWLTNARGFQSPEQSYFFAKAFITHQKINLFLPDVKLCEQTFQHLPFISCYPLNDMKQVIAAIYNTESISEVQVEKKACTALDIQILSQTINGTTTRLTNNNDGLIPFQSVKNINEQNEMKQSIAKADRAISLALKWIKQKNKCSEKEFSDQVWLEYQNQGAVSLSFATIAAFGANSSIIHYSTPNAMTYIQDGQLVLLDSGVYFTSGYATDATRTIFYGKTQPSNKQKQIYTLVLKGLLRAMQAVFPPDTLGIQIDALARQPIRQHGFDYAHGTGHGVGINVHESGFSLRSSISLPLKEGVIGSIEPGIYIPDFGGVRLENLVLVVKHPIYPHMLTFEPLTYIGFDHILIDRQLLEDSDIKYLEEYEAECKRRSTTY